MDFIGYTKETININMPNIGIQAIKLNCEFGVVTDIKSYDQSRTDKVEFFVLKESEEPEEDDNVDSSIESEEPKEDDNVDSSIESEENSEKFIDKTTDWINGTLALNLTPGMVGGLIFAIVVIYIVKKK
jgi:hypothetical protein